uniref:RRM domain-containing protein n=1 Tax=Syphacia muris TaxID=451379 RepID=A0A0N5AUY5_9BILA
MSIERSESSVVVRETAEANSVAQTEKVTDAEDISSTKLQKKKRKDNLLDLFSEHTDIGNWADAASESFPSLQKTDFLDEKSNEEQREEDKVSDTNLQFSTVHADVSFPDGSASHSHCGSTAEERSFNLFVSNIPWAAREEDLFYFFGGEAAVASIQLGKGSRPDWNNGSATITFHTLEAFLRGRGMDNQEFCGRVLKVRDHRRQPLSYRENRGYNDRQYRIAEGYPPRPDGNYGSHQYQEDGYASRMPRRNASYAGVPSIFTQNDSHSDFRRMQQNNASFRHHSIQNARPYKGRSSYSGAPLRKSPSEDNTLRSYDNNFRHIRKGSYTNDGQRPPYVQPLSTEPIHRRKLELAPRTLPLDTKIEPHRSSSIFGEAKPVDTSQKEREVEERLSREDRVTRTSHSRKGSSEVNVRHPPTSALPSSMNAATGSKASDGLERQPSETHIASTHGEKIVQALASKPPLPLSSTHTTQLSDTSVKENRIPVANTDTVRPRKLSGAPILMHSQSLPPLPKTHSRENVHEGCGPCALSKPSMLVFTNSSLKSKAYSGRRSERGRERSQYNTNQYHESSSKHSFDNSVSQRFRFEATSSRESRIGRRGSVSSLSKEKCVSAERQRNIVSSKSVINADAQQDLQKGDGAKGNGGNENLKESGRKNSTGKLKDSNSKDQKEKPTVNKEKKKGRSSSFVKGDVAYVNSFRHPEN